MAPMILTNAKSSEVAERIRDAVENALVARNLSARRASMDVVGHDGLIRDIRAGRIPSVDRVEALFEYLGLEAYFGPRRERPRDQGSPLIANLRAEDDAPAGYLTIPWAEAGSRPGSAPVAFARSWLQADELIPDFLQAAPPAAVDIDGTVGDDSLALLDTRSALRSGHGLWCYRMRGQVRVGRVTFAGAVTIVHAADANEPPQLIDAKSAANLGILGKVAWLGQSIPFKGKVG